MNVRLAELLTALREDERDAASAMSREADWLLEEWARSRATQPLPAHPFHRLWAMGGLSAQIALGYLAWWVRGWFSSKSAQEQRLADANLRAALGLLSRMVYLRGAVMKIGQALANFPEIVPAQYVETLGRLHFEAPPMHFSLLREQVRSELGAPLEELFDEFETEAFAAASLGQVHRARLKSGEPVAVKIQYPGIARAVDADLGNLRALLFPARLGPQGRSAGILLEEIRRMLQRETDYQQEAASLRRAVALIRPENDIVVPRVFPAYSSKRVLTMDYLAGTHIHEFLASRPAQESRDRFGTLMYRFSFRMYYRRLNYADPHPGNYFFLPDGRLGVVDFGCVQPYTDEECEMLRAGEASIVGDAQQFRDLVRQMGVLDEKTLSRQPFDLLRQMHDWVLEPVRHQGLFDFGDERHLRRGFDLVAQVAGQRHVQSHPLSLYLYRAVFGLRAMLYRLRARVDVRALHAEESLANFTA